MMVRPNDQATAERDGGTGPDGPGPPGRPAPPPARVLDRATDASVAAFALWTVIYHLGLLVRPPTWMLLAAWAVAGAACAGLYAWRRPRGSGRGGGGPALWRDAIVRAWSGVPRPAVTVAVVAGLGAGVSAGLREDGVPWWCAWTLGLVSVAATACGVLRGRAPAAHDQNPDLDEDEAEAAGEGLRAAVADRWGTLVAVVTAAGFAAASWFLVNPDGDDAYFVSRSVATATDGRIPFHDVMFTSGTTGPIAGEPPVSSIEVLAGALARVVGMHPASFLWYAVLPAVTFLAVWALWRLVREWAPRRALACFVVAVVYLLWAGVGQASLGSFHLLRMWQGKAIMLSVMVPLLYVYLTRWAERRTAGAVLLLAAAGVTSVGLTSSATLVVPLVTAAVAGPLIVSGRARTGLAACAAMIYPLGAGLAVIALHEDTGIIGPFTDAPISFSWVLLSGTMGVLAGCALWLAPLAARRGVPSLATAGTAAVATLLFVPGVLDIAAEATGAAQVMWRTMWIVPAPVLVGLLATLRWPGPGPHIRWPHAPGRLPLAAPAIALPVALSVALCAAMVIGGMPVWSKRNGTTVQNRPSWKAHERAMATARRIVRTDAAHGRERRVVVLMPQKYMRQVPLFSTRDHAVNPNSHYLRLLPAPRPFIDDRLMLSTLVTDPEAPDPTAGRVKDALRRTGVTVACTRRSDDGGLRLLEAAGYGGRSRVSGLSCVFPRGA